MSSFIVPSPQENCLFITCEGDLTLTEATDAWQKIREAIVDRHYQRLLVDITAARSTLGTGDVFDVAQFVWQDLPQPGRMALVVREDQIETVSLLETLVRNVGVCFEMFVNLEAAEAWLRGRLPGERTA